MNVMIAQMQERYYCRICIKIKFLRRSEVLKDIRLIIDDISKDMESIANFIKNISTCIYEKEVIFYNEDINKLLEGNSRKLFNKLNGNTKRKLK